ncbi:MAG TPA: amino acid permease, partial [Bacteroidia bacterium]
QVMGEDLKIFRVFSTKNSNQVPYIAIIFQSIITLIMILTSSFENILVYIGFTLNIFLFLTVLGVFVLRYKNPDLPRPYKTWGYPVVPAIFLLVTAWIIYEGLAMKTKESLEGLATISCGLLVYFADRFISKEKNNSTI